MLKQDGPSLESSSYLNVSLRYLGPWDPWTPGPWDSWTSSLLQHPIMLSLRGGWHCNYSFKLQVQISWRFEIDLDIETFRLHMELTWTQPGPDLDRPGPELDKSWQNGKMARGYQGNGNEKPRRY